MRTLDERVAVVLDSKGMISRFYKNRYKESVWLEIVPLEKSFARIIRDCSHSLEFRERIGLELITQISELLSLIGQLKNGKSRFGERLH